MRKPTTTTTTTEARLTKQEYIRQGDAICADSARKLDALPEPKSQEELFAQLDQGGRIFREHVDRFKALKPPVADQPTADQLNALSDQLLIKYSEFVAANKSGDRRAGNRAEREGEAIDRQYDQLAAQYGFVECSKDD